MREVRWERMFPDELESAMAACPVVWLPQEVVRPELPKFHTMKNVAPEGLPAADSHWSLNCAIPKDVG
jgi:hypothetical protein